MLLLWVADPTGNRNRNRNGNGNRNGNRNGNSLLFPICINRP
jgi:hypothetical protein